MWSRPPTHATPETRLRVHQCNGGKRERPGLHRWDWRDRIHTRIGVQCHGPHGRGIAAGDSRRGTCGDRHRRHCLSVRPKQLSRSPGRRVGNRGAGVCVGLGHGRRRPGRRAAGRGHGAHQRRGAQHPGAVCLEWIFGNADQPARVADRAAPRAIQHDSRHGKLPDAAGPLHAGAELRIARQSTPAALRHDRRGGGRSGADMPSPCAKQSARIHARARIDDQ